MDNFQKKFIEEAIDLINNLEEALLSLEQNPNNQNLINEIFRVMHSLKGGGAMFGFETISNYTHHLETIYDFIRNGRIVINSEILSVTLSSVDHLRSLLNKDDAQNNEIIQQNNDILTKKILSIIHKVESNIPFESQIEENHTEIQKEDIHNVKTFYFKFIPNENIFQNGTNPLYLIDELASLGMNRITVQCTNLPEINSIDVAKCYSYWEGIISANITKEKILDVFIFVEDDSFIEIKELSNTNWFELPEYKAFFDAIDLTGVIDIETLESKNLISNSIEQPISEDVSDSVHEQLKTFTKDNVISSIRVSSDKIDHLMNLVSELVTTQASISLFVEEHKIAGLTQIIENLENITRQLRDNAFSMSLIPLDTVITRFNRLVRDLSAEFKKNIHLKTEGIETELDKTLIQALTEPLMHIIRNSIDHGIESVEERIALGKPQQGTILLKAYYSGANVHIKIHDDGRGINLKKVREKAIIKGLITSNANLSDKEILDLVFLPGFSTANTITDISGRGVGMDIVKKKIAEIRGEVELQSEVNVGTTIIIKLPLTLSIIDGLLVKIDDITFVIPLSAVKKIRVVEHKNLIKSFNHILVIDGEQIPFHYLREEFEITKNCPDIENIVIVFYEEKSVGIVVDTIIGEYQAVLKPLGKMYKKQDFISGATILGDGTVALVMDTNKIITEFSDKAL